MNHRHVFGVAGILWWASLIASLWVNLLGVDVRWYHALIFLVMAVICTLFAGETGR